MTQGAVKTTGKRARAVSAKKKAILSAALDTFSPVSYTHLTLPTNSLV